MRCVSNNSPKRAKQARLCPLYEKAESDIKKSRPVVQVRDKYHAGRHFVWMILCFKKEMTFGDQLSESPSAILVKLIRITFPS
jgi:hypothetical protein